MTRVSVALLATLAHRVHKVLLVSLAYPDLQEYQARRESQVLRDSMGWLAEMASLDLLEFKAYQEDHSREILESQDQLDQLEKEEIKVILDQREMQEIAQICSH